MAELSVNCPKCGSANSVALGAEVETYACTTCGAENPLVESSVGEVAVDPLIGAVISDCEVMEKLGEGGFGAVYKAMDRNLQRPVALKVMLQSLTSSQEFVQKFIREAITAAQLNHPNIVAIHKVGRDEKRGIHYLIMELLEGKTLEHIVADKGVLKPEEATPLILQAAEALAAAHDKKIVHRDIKPENIMVDKRGVVKIMDFGLAKVVQPDMKSTKVMGTPHYMSPEQFEGKMVDGRTDIYSLGVTYYYVLSRARPYEGTNTVQIIYAILTSDPKSLLEANPSVPPEIWTIIQKMIAKKVDERYRDFREVRKDLVAYQEKTLADRVTCPGCGARNQRGKKFCRQCGGSLQVKCPACGADEVAGAQTCAACGASIEILLQVRQNLERAIRLKGMGDLRRAYLLLKEVLKLDPNQKEAAKEVEEIDRALREVESVKVEALELEKTGNLEEALKKVEDLLGRYPGSDDVKRQRDVIKRSYDGRVIAQHMKRADESIAAGNLQAGVLSLDQALRLDPQREDILARRKDLDTQVQAAEQARSRARDAFEAKRYSEAFRHATEVLRAHPTDAEMAQILEKCRGYLESSEDFVRRGRQHLDAGELLEARRELEAAAQLRADDPEVTEMLAEVDRRLARFRDLLVQARTALGDARFEEARARVSEVLQRLPGDPEALGLMATIARQESEALKAAEVLKALEEGEALEKRGDLEGALAAYRGGVEADPDSGKAVQARDRLESRMREVSSVRSLADEHLRDGRFEEALQSLEKLRKLLPGDETVESEAEEARDKVKHIQDSLRQAERAAGERNHRAAVDASKSVLDLSPNHVRAAALKRDAERALLAIDRHMKEAERLIGSEIFEDALEQLKKAKGKGATQEMVADLEKTAVNGITVALKTEATRFYSARDYGAALDAYERILELAEGDEDAKKGLAEAEKRLRSLTSEPLTMRAVVTGAAAAVLLMAQIGAVQIRSAAQIPSRDKKPAQQTAPKENLLDFKGLLALEGNEDYKGALDVWAKADQARYGVEKGIAQSVLQTLLLVRDPAANPLDAILRIQEIDGDLGKSGEFQEVRKKAALASLERLTDACIAQLDRAEGGNDAALARDLAQKFTAGNLTRDTLKELPAKRLVSTVAGRQAVLSAKAEVGDILAAARKASSSKGWAKAVGEIAFQESTLQDAANRDEIVRGFRGQIQRDWRADLKGRFGKGLKGQALVDGIAEAGAFLEQCGLLDDAGAQDGLIRDLKGL